MNLKVTVSEKSHIQEFILYFIFLLTCKLNQPKMLEITTGLAWAGAGRELAGKGLRDISALMEMFSF